MLFEDLGHRVGCHPSIPADAAAVSRRNRCGGDHKRLRAGPARPLPGTGATEPVIVADKLSKASGRSGVPDEEQPHGPDGLLQHRTLPQRPPDGDRRVRRAWAAGSPCSCCTGSATTGRPGTRWCRSSPPSATSSPSTCPGFGASPALPDGVAYDLPTVTAALGALCAALGIDRPHVAGNSLGGLLALELGREKLVRSVTALSPGGFWSQAERRYAFGMLRAMRQGARAHAGSRDRAARPGRPPGRAALTSTIYARPGRRSPDAVVAETLALRHAPGFARDPRRGPGRAVHRRRAGHPGDRRLGHPRPAAAAPPGHQGQARHPRGPAGAAARLRPRPR